ncbi:MAG TPA: SIS domain-containing protein [Pleomorphomonadaceae bacterium]|nr:SIS domain-containing protein [Pleomorphomonadaceae bacterium]
MSAVSRPDPDAALPGAPDPWAPSEIPAWRDGPPYAMTEMIDAEPALAARVADRLVSSPALQAVADTLREAAHDRLAITTTGCGTSQHAAIAVAALLADALATAGLPDDRLTAVQAFELSRRVPRGGVLLAVSHEGGTAATNDALRAAATAGAATVLITVSDRSPGAALAGRVLGTEEQDQSWCHTVGYLSPLVVGACLHGALRETAQEPEAIARQVAAGSDPTLAGSMAARLASTDRLLVVGSGADYAAARELALKVEEGARLPAVAHELETIRHGHLAAATERTGMVMVLTDAEGRGSALLDRAASVLRAAEALGMPAAVIAAAELAGAPERALAGAGWQSVTLEPSLPRVVAATLASVIPLQLLTERLARVRGTNPDAIGREDPRQAAAASA